MQEKIANIANDKKELLEGFKIFGLFPFFVRYIKTGTHVELCAIRAKIQELKGEDEPNRDDFYSAKLQSKSVPLINEYITIALINSRFFGLLMKPFIKIKVKQCSHSQVFHLYKKIMDLDEPAFFFTYWKHLMTKDHTLLKEVKPS